MQAIETGELADEIWTWLDSQPNARCAIETILAEFTGDPTPTSNDVRGAVSMLILRCDATQTLAGIVQRIE